MRKETNQHEPGGNSISSVLEKCFSETSVDFQLTALRFIQNDRAFCYIQIKGLIFPHVKRKAEN
jgi:hypothetical protein